MNIGFTELGRVMSTRLKEGSPYQQESILTLRALAERWPYHTFIIFGRTQLPQDALPYNVVWDVTPRGTSYDDALAWSWEHLEQCHRAVVFVNQHMSVSLRGVVPKLYGKEGYVTPLQIGQRSVAPAIHALNRWTDADPRHDPVFIVNDPRSTLKSRDLKWPPRGPIIAQCNEERWVRHYRFGDPRSPEDCGYGPDDDVRVEDGHWVARHRYIASSYELIAIDPSIISQSFPLEKP